MLQGKQLPPQTQDLSLSLLSKDRGSDHQRKVATTSAVDDRVDVIVLALIELLTIIDKSLPAVVCSRERFTESRNKYI